MKVKVTKTMANALNKAIDGYDISLVKMSENHYRWYVVYDIVDSLIDEDKNGMFSAIKVIYPDEYYACSRYLTTRDLTKAFRNSDKTWDGFVEEVKNMIAI